MSSTIVDMKNRGTIFARCTDCPACRAMTLAEEQDRDISVVELKISFEKRKEDHQTDEFDWDIGEDGEMI